MNVRSAIAVAIAVGLLHVLHAQVYEVEPNDTIAQATSIVSGTPAIGQLSSFYDVDHYRLSINSAGTIAVAFTQTERIGTYTISVLNSSGVVLSSFSPTNPPVTAISAAGTYFLRVKASITYSSAQYTLTATYNSPTPTITTYPVSQTVVEGTSATFSVVASGTPPLTYQWYKNFQPISGQTNSTLYFPSTVASDAGSYNVSVNNASGFMLSSPQRLTIIPLPTPPRLINLSVMTNFATNQSLTMGFVVGGTGNRKVLVRAVGPSLRAFGVSPPMSNPRLTLFNAQGVAIGSNDNWSSADAGTMAAVGAFALPSSSLDAALVATLAPGNHTVTVGGGFNDSGYALVEVYEVP